jgi:hypothetical protein
VPSSLIFAALAAAWLVVLVPMVAKRRQEVARTAESTLASRVLRRPAPNRPRRRHGQEVPMTGEWIADGATPEERRYRPGRGGYDPEAAALAARARYVYRQRVVVGLLAAAVVTLGLALAASSAFWWLQVVLDLLLVAYLGYLRRQVQIEDEVRNRRAARLAGSRAAAPRQEPAAPEYAEEPEYDEEQHTAEPPARPEPPRKAHPTAVAVEVDDEDPEFAELNPSFEPPYRRAVGE